MEWIEIKDGDKIPDKHLLAFSPDIGYSLGHFVEDKSNKGKYVFYSSDFGQHFATFTHYCLLILPEKKEKRTVWAIIQTDGFMNYIHGIFLTKSAADEKLIQIQNKKPEIYKWDKFTDTYITEYEAEN